MPKPAQSASNVAIDGVAFRFRMFAIVDSDSPHSFESRYALQPRFCMSWSSFWWTSIVSLPPFCNNFTVSDDILVQYTCTENTAILNCIRRSKRRYTKWITQRNHAFLSDTDTQIDTFMKGFWQQWDAHFRVWRNRFSCGTLRRLWPDGSTGGSWSAAHPSGYFFDDAAAILSGRPRNFRTAHFWRYFLSARYGVLPEALCNRAGESICHWA